MKPILNELPRIDIVLVEFWLPNYARYKDFWFCNSERSKFSVSPAILFVQRNAAGYWCRLWAFLKRKHSFFDEPVGDLLMYLCAPRQWCEKVVAIAHNAKGFDTKFIQNRAIFLKLKPKLILNVLKIIWLKINHLTFIDSVSFLSMSLRKLPEAFGPLLTKSWYPHFFNTQVNLNYVGPIPDIKKFAADEMSESKRKEFISWCNTQKDKVFDKTRVWTVLPGWRHSLASSMSDISQRLHRDWKCWCFFRVFPYSLSV